MDNKLNGIDLTALQEIAQSVSDADTASMRSAKFNVRTKWVNQTKTIATVSRYSFLGKDHQRHFEIMADEPNEFLGQNSAPNPQELLMAALNACLSVGYAVNAAAMGIKIHSLEIETDGELDLRGALGLDENVNPGYDEVSYVVRLHADAPKEKIEELHKIVTKTSANYANFSKAIRMVTKLEIQSE